MHDKCGRWMERRKRVVPREVCVACPERDNQRRKAFRDTGFALAGLGNDAGMYGCVQMLLDWDTAFAGERSAVVVFGRAAGVSCAAISRTGTLRASYGTARETFFGTIYNS